MLNQRGRNFICKGICLKIYSFVEQSSARHVIKMFGLDFEQLFDDCIGGIWCQSKHEPCSPYRPIFGKLRQEKHGNIDKFVFSTHVIPDYISDIECWEMAKFWDSWWKYHKLQTERGKLFHIILFMCQTPLLTLVCILTTWKLQRGKNLLFTPIERPRRSNAATSIF